MMVIVPGRRGKQLGQVVAELKTTYQVLLMTTGKRVLVPKHAVKYVR